MTKKAISILLALSFLVCMLPFGISTVSAENSGVIERLNALRTKFPDGKFWNHYCNSTHNNNGIYDTCTSPTCMNPDGVTDHPCTSHNGVVGVGGYDCNSFDGAIQCYGFANKIFYDVFGVYASQMTKRYDIENVTVGDWIRVDNDGHSAVVLSRNGDNITIVEANIHYHGITCQDCNDLIKWDRTISTGTITYFKHATNYDEINSKIDHDSLNASDLIQIYSQWDVDAYGSYDNRWINGSGCGLLTIGHALQWLGIIDRDVESADATICKIFQDSGYIGTVYVSERIQLLNYISGKYSNFRYDTNQKDLQEIIGKGGVAMISQYGHLYLAVDLSSDGNYVHIIDSCLTIPSQRGVEVYRYDKSSKQFVSENINNCAARTNVYWYCKDPSTSLMVKANNPNPLYSGGEYWVEKEEVSGKVFCGFYNKDADSQNQNTYIEIPEGDYYFKNLATGKYMTVSYSLDEQFQNVDQWYVEPETSDSGKMHVSKTTDGYIIRPVICEQRVINVATDNVCSGDNVNILNNINDSTQWWKFSETEGGYLVHCTQNQNCVLTSVDDWDIRVYSVNGDAAQVWQIQTCIIYNANGGENAPEVQMKNYGESVKLSALEPSREDYAFLGWSTNQNAVKAEYSSGSDFDDDESVVLFAVWKSKADIVKGDSDGDGEVTDWDAIMFERYLAGWQNADINLYALDIDGDGEFSDWDAILLNRYLAGWTVEQMSA